MPMDLLVTKYKCNKSLNRVKTRNYQLMRTDMMLLLMKSIFCYKVSNRFNIYKPI